MSRTTIARLARFFTIQMANFYYEAVKVLHCSYMLLQTLTDPYRCLQISTKLFIKSWDCDAHPVPGKHLMQITLLTQNAVHSGRRDGEVWSFHW